jgi:predicted transcriptional regulator
MPDPSAGRRPSGELEASVLAALWAADGHALTPSDVQQALGTSLGSSLARTTVTTILARLHEKGTVSRTRSGRGYAYLPVQDSPGLAARRMRTELDKSAQDDRPTVLARFVSELAPDDEALLRALLTQAEDRADPPALAADPIAGPVPAVLPGPADRRGAADAHDGGGGHEAHHGRGAYDTREAHPLGHGRGAGHDDHPGDRQGDRRDAQGGPHLRTEPGGGARG